MAVGGDVLVQLHMHHAVIGKTMHLAGLGLARLKPAQGFRDRHLIDDDLVVLKHRFGDAVAGLNDRRRFRRLGRGDPGGACEETADGHRVGRIVRPLVDHLEHIRKADDRGRDLDAAGSPAVGQRHFPRPERHLMARYRDGLEDRPADHPLGLFVQIGEVVAAVRHCPRLGHSAASLRRAAASRLRARTRTSSLWKST